MMQRRSPPKHRHDGTSPLPMGMDWSPPPRNWNGRDTVWPHDPRTGWSYCVTIPSWVVLPKSRNSDPVVFYRVQIGVQSPEGVTTVRGVLRRFNDFLKLLADLKKAFTKKCFPSAPSKGILRMKSRAMLEERRRSLEEWMTKLLSDIDLSRTVMIASFLELEALARSAFQDADQKASDGNSDTNSNNSLPLVQPNLSLFQAAGSLSLASDYGSDTAYEASEIDTPSFGQDDVSESGLEDLALDQDLTNPIEKLVKYSVSNIDEGLYMGQSILERLEDFPKHKLYYRQLDSNNGKHISHEISSNASFPANSDLEVFSQTVSSNMVDHIRNLSAESVGSDGISVRGREISNFGNINSVSSTFVSLGGETGVIGSSELQSDTPIILPMDQHNKLNRILLTMHQRLVNAKTDMEDLLARLNQEIAVKDYLNKKVNDLEVELETTKRKDKENLDQAILMERERLTHKQWEMEELRQKSWEMELKLKSKSESKEDKTSHVDSTWQLLSNKRERDQELHDTKQKLEDLSNRYKELETKSKGDIKVLVKEVKSLRRSQAELKQELSRTEMEKSEAEELLQRERLMTENATAVRTKLLSDCRILHDRLKEYNANLSIDNEGNFTEDSTTLADALRLLSTSNDQIEEAQLLAGFDESAARGIERTFSIDDGIRIADDELRKILSDIFVENAKLRKQVNCVMRRALKPDVNSTNNEDEHVTEDNG